MAENDLLIKIEADAKNATEAFDTIRERTDTLEESLGKVARVSGLIFASLTAEIGLATHAYAESEEESRRLNLTLQNQGIYSKALAESYKQQADAISKVTGIDDDAIVKGQTLLQTYIGQKAITEDLTLAAVNLGAKLGGDVSAGFEALGRAAQGNVRGLKQVGIEIEDGLTKQERLSRAVEIVNQKFANQAAGLNQGLGTYRNVIRAFDDIQKAIGERFAPIITLAFEKISSFLNYLKDSPRFVTFISGLLAAGTAVAGLTALVTAAVPVVLALAAAGTALSISFAPLIGIIGAIGLAVGGLAAYGISATQAKKPTEELEEKILRTKDAIEQLQRSAKDPIARFFNPKIDEEIEAKKKALTDLQEVKKRVESQQEVSKNVIDVTPKQLELARREAQIAQDKENRKIVAQRAANEVLYLEATKASDAQIALAKEKAEIAAKIEDDKYVKVRDSLVIRYAEITALQAQQAEQDKERKKIFIEEDLKEDQDYVDQKKSIRDILTQDQLSALEQQVLTEKEIRQKSAIDQAAIDIKRRNDYIRDEQKHGKVVALLNQTINTEQVQGAKAVSGELVALAQSKNATLKAIGKAASISSVIIGTAESAANIATQVPRVIPFPFFIPVVAALVAARVAFGAEQIATIQGAAQGALVEGGTSGRDSVPFLLEPGELVTPRKNFNEVVSGVQANRNSRDDEIVALLTQINEKPSGQNVVINGDLLGDPLFIDRLVSGINDRIEFGNARLRLGTA